MPNAIQFKVPLISRDIVIQNKKKKITRFYKLRKNFCNSVSVGITDLFTKIRPFSLNFD